DGKPGVSLTLLSEQQDNGSFTARSGETDEVVRVGYCHYPRADVDPLRHDHGAEVVGPEKGAEGNDQVRARVLTVPRRGQPHRSDSARRELQALACRARAR